MKEPKFLDVTLELRVREGHVVMTMFTKEKGTFLIPMSPDSARRLARMLVDFADACNEEPI